MRRAAPARARVGMTALYVLGVALVYATLGLVAGLTGSIFGGISTNKWALLLMANLLLVSGLALLDVFTHADLVRAAGVGGALRRRAPYGAFMMGATSGLVAAPCGAPAFAAVLTFVAATGSARPRLHVPAGVLARHDGGAGGRGRLRRRVTALPRSGAWLVWLKRAGGVLLLGMAEYYAFLAGRNS